MLNVIALELFKVYLLALIYLKI